MSTIANAADPAAALATLAAKPRPRFTYTIPAAVRIYDKDPTSITFEPLTVDQEIHGDKLVQSSGNFYEKVALALVAVDGKDLAWATGERDRALKDMSPKVRDLVLDAYKQLHSASARETGDFLASRTMSL